MSELFAPRDLLAVHHATGVRVGVVAKAAVVPRVTPAAKAPVAAANTAVVALVVPRQLVVAVASAVRAVGAPARVAVATQKVVGVAHSSLLHTSRARLAALLIFVPVSVLSRG